MSRERRSSFYIKGTPDEVVRQIADRFIQEKRRSRSKAMDNLQSRLLANAVVLMEAGYIDFEKLLGKVGDLEKTTVQKEKTGFSSMDKLEAFMQDLEKAPIDASEPLAAPIVAADEDDDDDGLDEEDPDAESEELEDASTPIES